MSDGGTQITLRVRLLRWLGGVLQDIGVTLTDWSWRG